MNIERILLDRLAPFLSNQPIKFRIDLVNDITKEIKVELFSDEKIEKIADKIAYQLLLLYIKKH